MRTLKFLPAMILTGYFVAGQVSAFRPAVMRFASLIAIVLLGLVAVLRREAGGFSAIDRGFLGFITINVVAFWGFPRTLGPLIADFPTGTLYLLLFLVVAVPAAGMNRYFTDHYAKRSTPEAVWGTSLFRKINRDLTWLWAWLFAVSALVTAIPKIFALPVGLASGLLFQMILPGVLLAGVGIPANRIYPRYRQRKLGVEPAATGDFPNAAAVGRTDSGARPVQEEKMDRKSIVVALNGSPHGAIGNTSQMIRMVAAALAKEEILVEEIRLSEKRIAYCVGCAFCLQKGRCWQNDDHAGIVETLLAADGIILASPVYFGHVTAQMKCFLDRSLTYGHKPRRRWKPGLAISVSAGRGETATAHYLGQMLGVYGSFPAGILTAIATNPGAFFGKEAIEARAGDLARDLATAIREKRQYPFTDEALAMFLFMRELVTREKDFMEDDYRYWQQSGLFAGFEAFAGQTVAPVNYDPGFRKEWLAAMIREERAKNRGQKSEEGEPPAAATESAGALEGGEATPVTCLELIRRMPMGFRKEAARNLSVVYQFEITGSEEFAAHLSIENGQCTFHPGPHGRPDVIVRSPAEVWIAIAKGELNGQTAFMAGKFNIEGDIGLMMRLKELFGSYEPRR